MAVLSVYVREYGCVLLILLLLSTMSKCLEGECAEGRVLSRRE